MIINNIKEYCVYIGIDEAHLERATYKYTACGAWIHWDDKHIHIGSIVEGSNAEFDKEFEFPCDTKDIENWFDELEKLTSRAWREANCQPWKIYIDGNFMGIYYGDDEYYALDDLAQDAGYKDWEDACESASALAGNVEVIPVEDDEDTEEDTEGLIDILKGRESCVC